jgi:uncharacterized LabA/DUF88 family protein
MLQQRYKRAVTADDVMIECERLKGIPHVAGYELLRVYYYDAMPASGSLPKPVSRDLLDLGETPRFRHSQSFFDQLVLKPDIALRMGRVDLSFDKWKLKPKVASELIKAPRALTDEDFNLDLTQKGVDMRIGMDMARLALRQMVRAVIVVTGDADFVPAFKYVRREGVKVILEPMGKGGRRELREHADIVLERTPKTKAQRRAAVASDEPGAATAD